MVKTAVLVSGGGMNLQSLLDAKIFGETPECDLAAVISSNPDAYALKRAEISGVPTYIVERELFPNVTSFGFALLDKLRDLDIELVVLAGFDCELTQPIYKHYDNKIINTFPALLPAFSDCPGEQAAEKQLAAGVKISGATVFFAGENGPKGIILQKAVAVRDDDTPAELARRILEEGENYVLPRAVQLFCSGRLKTENGVTKISDPRI